MTYDENAHGCLRSFVRLLCVPKSGCSTSSRQTCVRRFYESKIFFRRSAAVTTFSPKTCERWLPASCLRSCVQRIGTATSFAHHFDDSTSWLQPLESSV